LSESLTDTSVKLFGPNILTLKETSAMPLDARVKKSWEELQKKYGYPVNAIGVKIADKDAMTLKVWKDEGIDKFMKK
jgi:hypothetical protein